MTTRFILLAAIAAALAVPAGATAGGWATVGFDPPPAGQAPGEPWQVDLTILQHGVTPLEGVKPRVIVARADGGGERAFPARATEKPGVYRATVVFASAGTWSYRVDDGFAAVHTYPPVRIGAKGKRPCSEPVAAPAADDAGSGTGGAAPGAGGADGAATAGAGGDTAATVGDGPDYLLALAVAAGAGLAAALGATALQRRRGGPSPASG
jgi:YtkA-like